MTNISQKGNPNKELKGKKILYIVTQSKWGGAQKYVLDLAKYFAKDNEVHVAYGENKNSDKKFVNSLKDANIKTLPIPYLVRQIDVGKDYLALMEILKVYKAGKYDLAHLNSSKIGLLGSLAGRMYSADLTNAKLKIIYTAHGFVFNEPLSKFKTKIYKIAEKVSASINHAVLTVSEADRQSAITNKLAPKNKIITIHNGIDINNYNFYDRATALEKLSLEKNKKYFATIANFYKTKGYSYLIEAVKILKEEKSPILNDYQFILIGDGPELDNIKQQINANNLDKYFKLLGAKNDAYKYLPAFDAFILPSVKEGLPYTILEAGLAKIPIIASKVGGIPEIIEDKKTGLLIAPADPLSLSKAIKEINIHDVSMIEKNYQNIKDNFNLRQTLEKTKEIYIELS